MMVSDKPIRSAVLLGTQRFEVTPELREQAQHEGGPIAAITCGWQDLESNDADLRRHLGVETINLRLGQRADDAFRNDPELARAHRQRQQLLRHKQDFYRIRLQFQIEALRVIRNRHAPEEVHLEEQAASIKAIQHLDARHLDDCANIHRRFREQTGLHQRDEVQRHREEIAEVMVRCAGLAISGGHVASILNRLILFGVEDFIDGHHVLAWSAGAMAITDRIVLYHDSPPQGPGAAEVMDRGMGWVPGVVALPEPEKRLRMDDPARVGPLAARFRPAKALAFPAGTHLRWSDGVIRRSKGVLSLEPDGRVHPLQGVPA